MPTYTIEISINQKKHNILVESFGEGKIPIIISGHAEVYGDLLKEAFTKSGLLSKYKFFVPRLYWCKGAPLFDLPSDILDKLTIVDLARHIEEIRQGLSQKGLLEATHNKIGIYSHSAFSALAFNYAALFPEQVLFIEAEGPVPYLTAEWSKEKDSFFRKNASEARKKYLAKHGISPGDSAVDEKSMQSFVTFRDAYHKMNATLWYDFETDHRSKIWGNHELNMVMMRHYFRLLHDYDSRYITPQVKCPVHISMGIFDIPVPPYIWIDKRKERGLGFFEEGNRDYKIFTNSGHWPATEEPEKYSDAFDKFIDKHVVTTNQPRAKL